MRDGERLLTAAAAVTEVGKTPDIANANGIANERKYKFSFGRPLAPICIAIDPFLLT